MASQPDRSSAFPLKESLLGWRIAFFAQEQQEWLNELVNHKATPSEAFAPKAQLALSCEPNPTGHRNNGAANQDQAFLLGERDRIDRL